VCTKCRRLLRHLVAERKKRTEMGRVHLAEVARRLKAVDAEDKAKREVSRQMGRADKAEREVTKQRKRADVAEAELEQQRHATAAAQTELKQQRSATAAAQTELKQQRSAKAAAQATPMTPEALFALLVEKRDGEVVPYARVYIVKGGLLNSWLIVEKCHGTLGKNKGNKWWIDPSRVWKFRSHANARAIASYMAKGRTIEQAIARHRAGFSPSANGYFYNEKDVAPIVLPGRTDGGGEDDEGEN
jgi:hypothetical protein